MSDPFERKELEDEINDGLEEETLDLETEQEEIIEQEAETPSAAKKHGHLSKEEYQAKHGNLDGYKDEDQFNKYGEAWGEVKDIIKGMKKQLDERDDQLKNLVKYQERTEARAFERARQQLEAQLAEARSIGDVRVVEQLTREKAKQEFQEVQQQTQSLEADRRQVEQEFIEKNKHWFGINRAMTERAQQIDEEERVKANTLGLPLPYKSLAGLVEARMRMEYPDVMITSRAAPTISADRSSANRGESTSLNDPDKVFSKLSEEQKSVYSAVKRGYERGNKGKIYSKKDFINQLKKDGEI